MSKFLENLKKHKCAFIIIIKRDRAKWNTNLDHMYCHNHRTTFFKILKRAKFLGNLKKHKFAFFAEIIVLHTR